MTAHHFLRRENGLLLHEKGTHFLRQRVVDGFQLFGLIEQLLAVGHFGHKARRVQMHNRSILLPPRLHATNRQALQEEPRPAHITYCALPAIVNVGNADKADVSGIESHGTARIGLCQFLAIEEHWDWEAFGQVNHVVPGLRGALRAARHVDLEELVCQTTDDNACALQRRILVRNHVH